VPDGRPPFEGPPHVVLVSVQNDDPAPPRGWRPRLPRDLETICLKCLAKEPARRYASAEALAEDLRRFLAGEPVQARPVGRVERAVKWARRHPAPAALLGVTLLALVALTVLSGNLVVARNDAEERRREAEKQKAFAEQEAAKAERASDYLVSVFELADARGRRGTMTAGRSWRRERNIPQQFADQPDCAYNC